MTSNQTPYSEQEYFYKLDNMILTSCQYLMKLFKNRWKEVTEEEWISDAVHGESLDNREGKRFRRFTNDKKVLRKIKLGNVEHWDMTILSLVIQNFGDPDSSQYKKENEAVKAIKDIRNILKHHTTNKMPSEEYSMNVEKFRKALTTLHVDKEDIEKMIDRAGVTSSVTAMEKVKELHKQADDLIESNNFEAAIEYLTEALSMPSLLPVHLGAAYEKRAQCYIENKANESGAIEQAILDISEAIKLNESSWKAHYIAGQCHRKNGDFQQAIKCHQRALSISPVQKHVKNDLDGCKALQGCWEREDNMVPRNYPMNLSERVKWLEEETGQKMTENEFVKMKESEGEIWKGQDHVFNAHRYTCGWEVDINLETASTHFAKAAKVGNAEGIYNLGLCYYNGTGVPQDVARSLRYFLKAANMSPETGGVKTRRQKNIGVAYSQHMLGLMYEFGVGVDKDYAEAARWYKDGMENGAGQAANNLGLLYDKGLGVERDRKMAEYCWKDGVIHRDVNAPISLIGYYMEEMEPEQALGTFRTAKEVGNPRYSTVSEEEFQRKIHGIDETRNRHLPDVVAFENQHNLTTTGLTFKERLTRMHSSMDKFSVMLSKLMNGFCPVVISEDETPAEIKEKLIFNIASFSDIEKVGIVKEKAEGGSVIAKNVINLLKHCMQISELLQPDEPFYKLDKAKEIVSHLYTCATIPFDELVVSPDNFVKVKHVISELFSHTSEDKDDFDKEVRLIFAVYNAKSNKIDDTFAEALLLEGIKRYSENHHYYYYLAKTFNQKGDHKNAFKYAKEGLLIAPGHLNLLFEQAFSLHNADESGSNFEIIRNALQRFLKRAPEDHHHYPEANFALGAAYIRALQNDKYCKDYEAVEAIKEYYRLGVEAEKQQLPCFNMVLHSNNKKRVMTFLHRFTEEAVDFSTPNDKPKEQNILDLKPYLKSPNRKWLVQRHRRHYLTKPNSLNEDNSTMPPTLTQTLPQRLYNCSPITLQEMNPTSDHIYYDRLLDLTLIDEPLFGYTSIHLISEDKNGDATRLCLYNVDQDEKALEAYSFGTKLALLNPYIRLGQEDITIGIRNDEPKCIVHLGKVEKMCRFCGRDGVALTCKKCKIAMYCNQECQKLDWNEMDHRAFCRKLGKIKL